MVLARLQVAGVGRLLGFDVDELADLRLAVEELCLDGLARSRPEDRLRLEISWDDAGVKVCCGVDRRGGASSVSGATATRGPRPRDLHADPGRPHRRAGCRDGRWRRARVDPQEENAKVIALVMDDETLDQEFELYVATGDPQLRSRLVEAHLQLARSLARRFAQRGEPLEDLEQVAAMALVNAVDRYEPEHETAFSRLRDPHDPRGAEATLPRRGLVPSARRDGSRSSASSSTARCEELTHDSGRPPDDRRARARLRRRGRLRSSRRSTRPSRTGRPRSTLPAPTVGRSAPMSEQDDDAFETALQRATLSIATLHPAARDAAILRLRFVDRAHPVRDRRQVGLSQMHVSRRLALASARAAQAASASSPSATSPTSTTRRDAPWNCSRSLRSTKGEWSGRHRGRARSTSRPPALLQAITRAITEGRKVVVDLSAVSFLDSTGLGVLVQALNESTEAGGSLRLVVTDPNVLKVFEVTALDDVFGIHGSRDQRDERGLRRRPHSRSSSNQTRLPSVSDSTPQRVESVSTR